MGIPIFDYYAAASDEKNTPDIVLRMLQYSVVFTLWDDKLHVGGNQRAANYYFKEICANRLKIESWLRRLGQRVRMIHNGVENHEMV